MRTLLVVGIGAGNPEHMTVQAIAGLNRADVLFIPDKGAAKSDLAGLRREICDRFVTNPKSRRVGFDVPVRAEPTSSYSSTVDDWHEAIAGIYEALIRGELADDGCGAFLIWGDPSLYDSALRILERVRARGNVEFALEVIPGITAIQALAASHKMALNRISDPFVVTTGRRLAEDGMPGDAGTAVVMLCLRDRCATLVARCGEYATERYANVNAVQRRSIRATWAGYHVPPRGAGMHAAFKPSARC